MNDPFLQKTLDPYDDNWPVNNPPKTLGSYIIGEPLGQGGWGCVFDATHSTLTHLHKAVKVLDPRLSDKAATVGAFFREAHALAALHQHPRVVQIEHIAQEGMWAYLVMEKMDGFAVEGVRMPTVAHWLSWLRQQASPQGISEAAVIRIAADVLEALISAHNQGMIHRDIKPANILLTADGGAKLSDFGLVAIMEAPLRDCVVKGHSMEASTSQLRSLQGTITYMSPEQKTPPYRVDARSDLYSLALVIHEMLTGEIPGAMMEMPREKGMKVHPGWDAFLRQMLRSRPELRLSNAEEMRHALMQLSFIEPVEPTPEKSAPPTEMATPPAPKPISKKLVSPVASPPVDRPILATPQATISPAIPLPPIDPISPIATSPQSKGKRKSYWIIAAACAVLLIAGGMILATKNDGNGNTNGNELVYDGSTSLDYQSKQVSENQPFENSLGMKFVPIGITNNGKNVLFSIWETRLQDYEVYAKANSGVDDEWNSPGFEQENMHPVVNVSHDDAVAFCQWLTKEEQASGKIGPNDEYRLPTDAEWSYAVGIGEKEDASVYPSKKKIIANEYPWGSWGSGMSNENLQKMPSGSGNYESNSSNSLYFISDDPFDYTSPVGSFTANPFGIYDLGGNVEECCCSYYGDSRSGLLVLRGGSWNDNYPVILLSSYRNFSASDFRCNGIGFRCVLVVSAR